MTSRTSTAVRLMTEDDIDLGMSLKNLAGWNQLPADWERVIRWQPDGCFVASHDGRACGTASSIRYQDRFGWVGMVVVHPDMRRRGIGKALLMAAIEHLETAGVLAVKLDATPAGKKLYDTIGFACEYEVERHQAMATVQEVAACVQTLPDDALDALCQRDAEAFGADRSRVLRRLYAEAEVTSFVVLDGSRIEGYAFVRPGMNAQYIGPWVAENAEAADALFRAALNAVAGKPVFVDISLACPHSAEIIAGYGFELQRPLIRMFRGENRHPGDTRVIHGIAGPAIG